MNKKIKLSISLFALALSYAISSSAIASDAPAPAASADKPKASTTATATSSSSDDDMSKALLNKINKGSGDIVIRTGDLPASNTTAQSKPESKPKATKAAAKAVEKDHHDVHWSYVDGPGGPENWGNLSKDNLACLKGKTQSPININVDRAVKAELTPLEFLYRPSQLAIVDNGHTIQVNYGEGSNLIADGRQYRLVQFHFHKPSEEAINGERTDMVAHLVHQHHDGSLAVVGVLMTTKPPAASKT